MAPHIAKWPRFSKKKLFLWSLISLLLSWHMVELRQIRNEGNIPLSDFIEYWSATRALVQGQNPYSSEVLFKIQKTVGWNNSVPLMMWNPPWTLPLLLPFTCLSFWTDRSFWYLFNLVLIFMIVDWFWRMYAGSESRRWLSWLAVLFFIPAGISLYLGQISPLLLMGLSGFLWALQKKWLGLAGAFLILLSVKPQVLYLFWIFVLFWIVKERAWPVLWGALTAITFSSLLVVILNPSIFYEFFSSIGSPSGPTMWQTPTWGVALHMLFPGLGKWIQFLPSFFGLLLAWPLWRMWRRDFEWRQYSPTIILLSVTTSSFTWTFDWVVLLPIVIVILIWFQTKFIYRCWLMAGLALVYLTTFVQPFIVRNYFYGIWLPPALWLLYFAVTRSRTAAVTAMRLPDLSTE